MENKSKEVEKQSSPENNEGKEQISRAIDDSLMDNEKLLEKSKLLSLSPILFLANIFFFFFSAFYSGQDLVSQIYDQIGYANTGQVLLTIKYATSSINSLFVSFYMQKISFKKAFFFSSLGYVIFLAVGAVSCLCEFNQYFYCYSGPIYLLNIISAAANGFCVGIIWTVQYSYVVNMYEGVMRGKAFGVF